MVENEFEPSEENVNQFQRTALNKVQTLNIGHQRDVDRLKNDKKWIRRFLIHAELDEHKALNMIIDTLKWRLKFGANDISHTNINMDVIRSGALFPRCRDKDGKLIFVIKVKLHAKAFKTEDLQRVLVYWFDRIDREEKGDKISVFFEATGAGLANLDMDFIQYLITLFRDYYPNFINYIYVFELPWILNAAWKIIKSWMPGKTAELVKFVGRSDLTEYVPLSDQLTEWGGKLNYKFAFEPESSIAEKTLLSNSQISDADNRKKVSFAEFATSGLKSMELSNYGDISRKPLQGQLLHIHPAEEIFFQQDEFGETTGLLTITNVSDFNVAYKIKTTSTERYRVRPSSGVLGIGEFLKATFHIHQSTNSVSQLVRDKFLIMAFKVDNHDSLDSQQLAKVWKEIGEASIQNYRLRCSVEASDSPKNNNNTNDITVKLLQELVLQVQQILNEQTKLVKQMKQTKLLFFVISLVTGFAILFIS